MHAARVGVKDEVEAALVLLRESPRLLLVREREEERALVIVPRLAPDDRVGLAVGLKVVPEDRGGMGGRVRQVVVARSALVRGGKGWGASGSRQIGTTKVVIWW